MAVDWSWLGRKVVNCGVVRGGWGTGVGLWASLSLMLPGANAVAEPPANDQSADEQHFNDQFRPLMVRYCVSCHSGEMPKGKLRLDNLTLDLVEPRTREHWSAIVERL